MNIIKTLLKSIVIFAVLLAVIGLFLPASTEVSRTVTVKANPDTLFPFISDFNEFNRWSPWYGVDPDARYRIEGPANGVGSKLVWESEHPRVGSGSQQITAMVPGRSVDTVLEFQGQGGAEARFELNPENDQTHVTWKFQTDWGFNLMGRYMGLMMDEWVGGQYEHGLEKLKILAEAG